MQLIIVIIEKKIEQAETTFTVSILFFFSKIFYLKKF